MQDILHLYSSIYVLQYKDREERIMKIRLMTKEDAKAAITLWNGSVGVGKSPDDSVENICKYLKRNPSTSFVVEECNEIVGAIMAGHDGYRGFIHHTAVAEKFRCLGIGKQLVGAALHAIEREGVHKVVLVVFNQNEQANKFWEKQGFEIREDLLYRDLRLK